MAKARALLVGCGLLWGCAGSTSAYEQALNEARDDERKHDLTAATASYRRAASLARSEKDRVEALYREAQAFRREHDFQSAIERLEALVREHPSADRAPRALLDQGRLWKRLGHPDRAEQCFLRLLDSYPTTVSAESAVDAYLREQPKPHSAALKRLLEGSHSENIDELLRLRLGQALAEEGSQREAIRTLEALARDYPLPASSRTDEALLLSARLRRSEGDFEGTLRILDLLANQSTSSDIVGSYVRSAFPEALWMKAEVLRDDLGKARAAEEAFLSLPRLYPESTLADDALWQAGFLAQARGDTSLACDVAEQLQARKPPSRYQTCTAEFCATATRPQASERCEHAKQSVPARVRTEVDPPSSE